MSPPTAAVREKAFAALRSLCFREREVARALADSALSERGSVPTLERLDLESIVALGDALQKYQCTCVVVTHDRDLVNERLVDWRGTYA